MGDTYFPVVLWRRCRVRHFGMQNTNITVAFEDFAYISVTSSKSYGKRNPFKYSSTKDFRRILHMEVNSLLIPLALDKLLESNRNVLPQLKKNIFTYALFAIQLTNKKCYFSEFNVQSFLLVLSCPLYLFGSVLDSTGA